MKRTLASTLAVFVILAVQSNVEARLAANRLAANRLGPMSAAEGSAAASELAASRLAIRQIAPGRFAANAASTQEFMATGNGREVLGFIVSCALPVEATLVATLPNGDSFEFFGELGLATEWIDHPLKKAGRGWVSSCLFARINENDVAIPISMRGPSQTLASSPDEVASWSLEEGAFYGDYFVAPGEPVQWIACRGRDQALGETAGLIDRDCAEPDPADPTHTRCGFLYAGDCSVVCEHVAPDGYYRKCQDQPGDESHSDAFRQVITTFVLGL
jgi:hypothetical protein